MHIMVIIHYEVEYDMNKLVLLNDIKRKNKVNKIIQEKNKCKLNNIVSKDYKDFKEKFCKYIDGNVNVYDSNMNDVTDIIKKLFLLDNEQPFIDLMNFLYDDCLGTNTVINFEADCVGEQNAFIMSALDDYRKFRYKVRIRAYDSSNIAIYIKKDQIDGNFQNVVNFKVKKNMYKKACDNEEDIQFSKESNELKIIIIDSNVEVPDLFELVINNGTESENYELNIFKSWKYDFKKLVENNIYLLSPLKIFDLKKRLIALNQEGYSEDFLKEEIVRFFKEINASLYRIKDKGKIDDEDIKRINIISMELLGCFIKDKNFDLSEIC